LRQQAYLNEGHHDRRHEDARKNDDEAYPRLYARSRAASARTCPYLNEGAEKIHRVIYVREGPSQKAKYRWRSNIRTAFNENVMSFANNIYTSEGGTT
jgi:DNA gyrase/topoisomerase IV subunit B